MRSLPSVHDMLHPRNPRVLVAAHRGEWSWAPENSLAAIDEAIAHGADIVECDVRATQDGVLVLMHDKTLNRMTTLTGAVSGIDWYKLRHAHLRAGAGGPSAPITSLRPPTLSEALECCRGRVVLNVDTKQGQLADRVAEAVMSAGMSDHVFVKAAVGNPGHVREILDSPFYGRVPFVPMMKVGRGELVPALRLLEPLQCPMYEVEFADLQEVSSAREEFERLQSRLWVNTIEVSHSPGFSDARAMEDASEVWGRLVDAGVGAIQTDAVKALVDYLTITGVR